MSNLLLKDPVLNSIAVYTAHNLEREREKVPTIFYWSFFEWNGIIAGTFSRSRRSQRLFSSGWGHLFRYLSFNLAPDMTVCPPPDLTTIRDLVLFRGDNVPLVRSYPQPAFKMRLFQAQSGSFRYPLERCGRLNRSHVVR